MRIIARELGCTAVRVSGSRPERISIAAQAAAAEGLEVWFAPFPPELTTAELIGLFRDCADRAEQVRREGARVVLVMGCEVTLFAPDSCPARTSTTGCAGCTPSPRLYASFALMPRRLNAFLAEGRRRGPRPVRRAADLRRRDLGAGRLVPVRHRQRRRLPRRE